MKCQKCNREAIHIHYIHWKDKPLKGNHRFIQQEHPEWFQNLCVLCHAEVHNISPKKSELKQYVVLRERAIKTKNAIENQIRGFSGIESIVPDVWNIELKHWEQIKKCYTKKLEYLLKVNNNDLKTFLENIFGISVITIAYILAYLPKDLIHPKKLLTYWGLDPTHMKRRKEMSKDEVKKCGIDIIKKQLLGVAAITIIKCQKKHSGTEKGKYYDVYIKDKERRLKLHPELKKIHIEKQARRRMIEVLVNDIFYIAKKEQNQNGGEKNTELI